MKKCGKCKTVKDLDDFCKHKTGKGGLSNRCKQCYRDYYLSVKEMHNTRMKEYHKKNSDKIKKYMKDYAQANSKKLLAYKKQYYVNNKTKFKELFIEHYSNNKFMYIAAAAKRRGVKMKATPKWLSKAHLVVIRNIYKRAKELEQLSYNKKFHVDHIIPLQGENASGLHVPWNLQILTREENISKSNKIINQGVAK
jgi:hypothetical protein